MWESQTPKCTIVNQMIIWRLKRPLYLVAAVNMTGGIALDFMETIVRNAEVMFIFDALTILIGIILLFDVRKRGIWYKISVHSVCFVNAFFWGSFIFFRMLYSNWAFLAGGFCGLLLTLIFYKLKRETPNYLFCFWCLPKALLICMNYFMEHSEEKMEESIFLSALIISAIVMGLILFISFLYKRLKGDWKNIKKLHMICSLFYGAFLITGGLYEFIYDVSTRDSKFLGDEMSYVNFYKALLKVDWTEDGTGIFFGVVCILIIMLGALRQCLYKDRKGMFF